MARRRTLRRRSRGGGNPLKALVFTILGGLALQPAAGLSWKELNEPMSSERIREVAESVTKTASKWNPPSFSGYALPQIEKYVNYWNTELSKNAPVEKSMGATKHQVVDQASWMNGKIVTITGEEGDQYFVKVDGDEDPTGEYAISKGSLKAVQGGRKRQKTLRRKK